jgi:hypothetical protein
MPDAEQCIQSAHCTASSTAAGQRQNISLPAYKLLHKKKVFRDFVGSVTRYFQTTFSYSYLLWFFSSFPYKTRLSVRS